MRIPDGRNKGYWFLTRREFFTRPLKRMKIALAPLEQGEPIPCRIRLDSLRHIPETALMCVTPVLRQGWTARICEDGMAYLGEAGQEGIVSLGPECAEVARLFDGTRTLEQVAAVIEFELGITPERSASIVREAFLTLSEHEVYHPNVPLGPLPALSPEEDPNV